ncbi:MAG: substrate-binding domain-containing protein [Caulobacteraceae bacterium]
MRTLIAAAALAALLCACHKPAATPASMAGGGPTADGGQLSGAGATFPAPVYDAWARDYQQGVGPQWNYQAIGSGGGVKQIMSATVDFGASDKPLKADELARAGLTQFPTVMGGVVPVVNTPGIAAGQLRLDGPLLADVFAGKVADVERPAHNGDEPGPGAAEPADHGGAPLGRFGHQLPVHLLPGGGKPGVEGLARAPAMRWTGRRAWGARAMTGVSAFVRQTAGSIGYVEYAYAGRTSWPMSS